MKKLIILLAGAMVFSVLGYPGAQVIPSSSLRGLRFEVFGNFSQLENALLAPKMAEEFDFSAPAVGEKVQLKKRQYYCTAYNTAPAGLAEFYEYLYGHKSVSIGMRNGDCKFTTAANGNIMITSEGHQLAFFQFWGSNSHGYGYPFAAIEGDSEYFEVNEATGVVTYFKPYLSNNTRSVYRHTLTPIGDNRVKVEWDTGSEDKISPWVLFENDTYRDANITLGGTQWVNNSLEDLLAPANSAGIRKYFPSTGIINYNVGDVRTGMSIIFEEGSKNRSYTTESIGYKNTATWSNVVCKLIYRAEGVSAAKGSFVIDLGQAYKRKAAPGPQNLGVVDFWRGDATEVTQRPTRNLLPNGDFAMGFRYWQDGTGGATFTQVPEDERRYQIVVTNTPMSATGTALMMRTTQVGAMSIRSFPIALEKGCKYTISGYMKAPNNNSGVSCSLHNCSKMGKHYGPVSGTNFQWRANKTWTRNSFTFTADGTGVILGVCSYGDKIMFTGFQLEKGETATDWTRDPIISELVTVREDDQLDINDSRKMRLDLQGAPNSTATLNCSLYNPFRENLYSHTYSVTFDTAGRASYPLDFTRRHLGQGLFVLRTEFVLGDGTRWADHHRFSIMPRANTTVATRDVFGTLFPEERLVYADRLNDKMHNYWGWSSTTWKGTKDVLPGSYLLNLFYEYNISNWGRCITSDGVFANYKYFTNVTPAMEAEIEEVAYNTVHTNDSRFTVWAFGNEEEYSAAANTPAEYVKVQLATYRGVKRANPEAWVMPSHGTSGYFAGRGYNEMERYIAFAHTNGVHYDAIGIHQYGNIDGGSLGVNDMLVAAQYLKDTLAKYGYPDTTPIITSECFNHTSIDIPEWGTDSNDMYQSGRPSYDFSRREFIQAASAMRIYLNVLHDWPRHKMANIWISYPQMDHTLTPTILCKVPNTLLQHFDDVRLVGDVIKNEWRAYVFERIGAGDAVAAIWLTDERVERGFAPCPQINLSLPSDAKFYDMMGNLRRISNPLTISPALLIIRSSSAQELLNVIKQSTNNE